jgi:uncharacterized protein (TIGR03437 family)
MKSRAAAILILCSCAGFGQDVLTANYGNDRTGANLQEITLNPDNVNSAQFGKLGTFPVDGQIYAQPLYAAGVMIGGSPRNVVYVATMHNSVYAIDAENPGSTVPIWHTYFGPAVPSTYLGFRDAWPEVGILGTPVIDLSRNAIYLVTDGFENGVAVFRLHALDLSDGREILNGPVRIRAVIEADGEGSVDGRLSFDPAQHLQRPGLLLANDTVYVAFGSHADMLPYHGWLMGYSASNVQVRAAVFNTTPAGSGGSVWQSGRGLAADEAGNLLVGAANGDYDGAVNFGNSFLKLAPDLALLDWFAPADWKTLSDDDEDVGSLGPVRIPGAHQFLGGDKAGNMYLIDEGGMGHLGVDGAASPQTLQPVAHGGIFNIALWNSDQGPIAYVVEQGTSTSAFRIVDGQVEAAPFTLTSVNAPIPYQGMSVSANGGSAATGILWMTTGDYDTPGVPGTLHAFHALDLTRELWNSGMSAADALGAFAKFAAPTVANGRVYVPTFSSQLAIYGLTGAAGTPLVASVVNGASRMVDAVSPGEVVVFAGQGLGPQTAVASQPDDSGRLPFILAGTRVWFDGMAAPILSASAGQVTAVVPYSVTGDSTVVQVEYMGALSSAITLHAAATSPALFAGDDSGSGQALALNQDGTPNSPSNPAEAGSAVLLYATGLGQTDPPAIDGSMAQAAVGTPLASVTVAIDAQNADVLESTASPGKVQGVFQIRAIVPAMAGSGDAVPVAVQVGEKTSQPGLFLSVGPPRAAKQPGIAGPGR